eukprot:1904141-Pyramimonas_sp.AAC.1
MSQRGKDARVAWGRLPILALRVDCAMRPPWEAQVRTKHTVQTPSSVSLPTRHSPKDPRG